MDTRFRGAVAGRGESRPGAAVLEAQQDRFRDAFRDSPRAGLPRGAPDRERPLAGRVVALIFEKPSTRTRVSFDVGVRQLGGETLVLSGGGVKSLYQARHLDELYGTPLSSGRKLRNATG